MTGNELYVARFSAWAPGVENAGAWNEWAAGTREIPPSSESPEIAFTDSLFRRRLSQISKMTIQVVHDLLPLGEATKAIFLSFRGELSRQYKINKMVIEDKALMPAAFSLSVFNAPIALASIALGLKGGYTAIYPGGNSFAAGLDAATAALFSGAEEELLLVYADEAAPPEYECITPNVAPLAFGILFARKSCAGSVPLAAIGNNKNWGDCPEAFLKQLILCKGTYASA